MKVFTTSFLSWTEACALKTWCRVNGIPYRHSQQGSEHNYLDLYIRDAEKETLARLTWDLVLIDMPPRPWIKSRKEQSE